MRFRKIARRREAVNNMLNIFFNIANAITIQNPLGVDTIEDLVNKIAGYVYGVSAAFATIMILIGAFQILTAEGDAAKYKKGKDTILYTVIGLAIILLAGGIVSLVSGVLGKNDSGATAPVERRIDVEPFAPSLQGALFPGGPGIPPELQGVLFPGGPTGLFGPSQ